MTEILDHFVLHAVREIKARADCFSLIFILHAVSIS